MFISKEKCMSCCWARVHDDKVFCLFVNDTCLKHDQVFKNAQGEKKKTNFLEKRLNIKTNENK